MLSEEGEDNNDNRIRLREIGIEILGIGSHDVPGLLKMQACFYIMLHFMVVVRNNDDGETGSSDGDDDDFHKIRALNRLWDGVGPWLL